MGGSVIIDRVAIKNFKNLVNIAPDFTNLSIMVGPNGSGKSNLVQSLRFLYQATRPGTDSGLGGLERALLTMGGSALLNKRLARPDLVQFEYNFNHQGMRHVLSLALNVGAEHRGIQINEEALGSYKDQPQPYWYYRFHDQGPGVGVIAVKGEDRGKTKFTRVQNLSTGDLGLTVLPKILEDSSHPPELVPAFAIRRTLLDYLDDWRFYNGNDLNVKSIREATPKIGPSDTFLREDGSNLPLVIHNLSQTDLDFEEDLQETMKTLFPETRRLRATVTGRANLSVEWWVNEAKEQLYLDEMSDGTVRMLLWATILKSPKLPSLLVLDEPEMGLHVAWLPILAGWIKQAATRTQVFLSTHSPDLLDEFTEDHVEHVLRFKTTREGVCIEPLKRSMIEPQLSEGWQLGDLYRAGDPDFGAWPW